jgi:murein DD-endopeptidase MepM/ murein hydrolase activator NlpD
LVAEATAQEAAVRDTIAEEEEARRIEAERRAREAAERDRQVRTAAAAAPRPAAQAAPASKAPTSSGGGSSGSSGTTASAGAAAPVVGNIACPVGSPRSYSNTWGAPRSGGRSHKGTDILAPHGTPIYAYESGVVTRMSGSSLGGISLYMRGNSGTSYYYTHLSGYVSGISAGSSVTVGQHIAKNGDTGNARGTPHLHFEVMPGGGGNVNPYPYVLRACG